MSDIRTYVWVHYGLNAWNICFPYYDYYWILFLSNFKSISREKMLDWKIIMWNWVWEIFLFENTKIQLNRIEGFFFHIIIYPSDIYSNCMILLFLVQCTLVCSTYYVFRCSMQMHWILYYYLDHYRLKVLQVNFTLLTYLVKAVEKSQKDWKWNGNIKKNILLLEIILTFL